MAAEALFAIIFDELSDERRQIVQALVKEKSDGWWHNFPNVWIAGGESVSFWRDAMKPIVAGTKASVLVLRLDMKGGGRWAAFGPSSKEKFAWLADAFHGTTQ